MTIAIGILCSDGIVLSADSQETFNEYAKLQRAKVFELSLIHPDVKVVIAGSGDSNFYDALRERLEDGIDMAEPDLISIRNKIEEVIVGYCTRVWPLYAAQKDRPSAQMLIGIRATDGFALLHTEGPITRQGNSPECIGFGADFSLYHLKKLFKNTMLCAEVCPIAAYVLDLAKENVEFCGGASDVFVIPSSGDVERKDQGYIQENTNKYKSFALTVDGMLARAPSLRMQEDKYLSALLEFYDNEPNDYRNLKPEDLENVRQMLEGVGGVRHDQTELAFASLVKEHGSIAKALWGLLDFQKKVLLGEIEWPENLIISGDGPSDLTKDERTRELLVYLNKVRRALKDIREGIQHSEEKTES